MDAPRHRIGYIDGLRAIAVLAVVASHAYPGVAFGDNSGVGMFGITFGVNLFFVISGFCLAYPTLRKLHDNGAADFDVSRYAAHRFVRILPPYYIAIAVLYTVSFFTPSVSHVSFIDVVRQALFLDRDTHLLTPPFWTLPIEFRWYFLFPAGLYLWVRYPKALVAIIIALVAIVPGTFVLSMDILCLPAFLAGIIAAGLHFKPNRQFTRYALPVSVVLLVALSLRLGEPPALMPAWQAAVFLLVVAAGSSAWLHRLLSMKWLTTIGLASYSIYLVHAPVVAFSHSRGWNPVVAGLLGVSAGFIFFLFAERPFLKGPLRSNLIGQFETFLPRWFASLGLERSFHLGKRSPIGEPHRTSHVGQPVGQ
jgi:peptidoglycan/LPS O-acetylase OafA/YrhL